MSSSQVLYASVAPGDTDTYKIYMRPGDLIEMETEPANPGDQVVLGVMVLGPDTVTVVHDFEGPNPGFDATASVEGYRYVRIHAGTGPGGSYTLPVSGRDFRSGPIRAEQFHGRGHAPSLGLDRGADAVPWNRRRDAVPDTDYFSVQGVAGEIGLFRYSQQGGGRGAGQLRVFGPSGLLGNRVPQLRRQLGIRDDRHVLSPHPRV